jgi:hypothetical protein
MKRLKMSPEELKAESLRFHASTQQRKQAELRAVEEMSKHPLSLEQKRAQAERLRAAAGLPDKRKSHLIGK